MSSVERTKAMAGWIALGLVLYETRNLYVAEGRLGFIGWTILVTAGLLVFNWREALNGQQRVETNESVTLLNDTDAEYQRTKTVSSWLWPVRRVEFFIDTEGRGTIEDVRAMNTGLRLTVDRPQLKRGTEQVPRYLPKLLAWGRGTSARTGVRAVWRGAFPPNHFMVATGVKPSRRLVIDVRWLKGVTIARAEARDVELNVERVRHLQANPETLPWSTRLEQPTQEPDGCWRLLLIVEEPLPNHAYSVSWEVTVKPRAFS